MIQDVNSLPKWLEAHGNMAGQEWIRVGRENIRLALGYLKGIGYHGYCCITAVDHLATPSPQPPPERFEVIYQLRNMERHEELRIRVPVPETDPRLPTVTDIFAPANWDERETWDMFGIEFDGHPDLTRILMPDEWIGHPLRRDFPVGGEEVDFSDDHQKWQQPPLQA
ncbi:MAG: NADH-quinone oxidoreductase subunit C [Candidatus Dormibacteraceae bacterium]